MSRAAELNPLQSKIHPDQSHQIDAGDDDITPQDAGRFIRQAKMLRHQIEDFAGEKGDLPFVVTAILKVAIAANAATCDAFDRAGFHYREFSGFSAVMTYEIMTC